jgi:hypothetical protein
MTKSVLVVKFGVVCVSCILIAAVWGGMVFKIFLVLSGSRPHMLVEINIIWGFEGGGGLEVTLPLPRLLPIPDCV